eukprot:Skav210328  [mRNA]  locus=scaffold475:359806:360177:+ [translate_table: standard]
MRPLFQGRKSFGFAWRDQGLCCGAQPHEIAESWPYRRHRGLRAKEPLLRCHIAGEQNEAAERRFQVPSPLELLQSPTSTVKNRVTSFPVDSNIGILQAVQHLLGQQNHILRLHSDVSMVRCDQ